MGVHRSATHRGAGAPDFPEELDTGSNRAPPAHQGEQQAKLGVGHSHRLALSKHRLRRRLQRDASESNRAGPSGGQGGGKPASSVEQLLYPRDELPHDRRFGVPPVLELHSVGFHQLRGQGRPHLVLVEQGSAVRGGRVGQLACDTRCQLARSTVFVAEARSRSRKRVVVDDENSRSASGAESAG